MQIIFNIVERFRLLSYNLLYLSDCLSQALTCYTGLDVLCHALESYTAVPYFKRGPAPTSPLLRPAYQGCNPISDIWSGFALQQCSKYIARAVEDNDPIAREQMSLASTAAGEYNFSHKN